MPRNDKQSTCNTPAASGSEPLLSHPALVPMPPELAPGWKRADATLVSGERRAKTEESGYIAPVTARLERTGKTPAVVARLKRLRREVLAGSTILLAITDGQLDSWQAREPLSVAAEAGIVAWDERRGRTRDERLVVVDKALALTGHVRRGGWRVSR